MSLLSIENLTILFKQNSEKIVAVDNVSYEISKNEIVAVVGESGSGKSVTSLAIMGLLNRKNTQINGSIYFEKKSISLLHLNSNEFRNLRGNEISMIFQEPMSSLNPSLTCGFQVAEIIRTHIQLSKKETKNKVIELFKQVKLPRPESIFKAYPHQISGGQKQRVMIAMAIACKPKLLIADEPTTALDVTVQKEIITLLKEIQKETQMSILFISHDLGLVQEMADRVIVMYKGKVVEDAFAKALFSSPKNDYTKALLKARPSTKKRCKYLPTISDISNNTISETFETVQERTQRHKLLYNQKPLLEIQNVEKEYISKSGFFEKNRTVKAVDNISFKVYPGETLGLVGESGCGKSTLGNAILQLNPATAGTILYNGKDITHLKRKELRLLRREIQFIFQDPFASLNPRMTVGEAILEPMKVHDLYGSNSERKAKVIEILNRVGLEAHHYDRYPHEFSGGQRQRIGIARTIAVNPKLIICDESVSALDISVQAQVLNLLNELKDKFSFTYIFISHDLAVVKHMADQLIVMQNGKIEEQGEADKVYAQPTSSYTKSLIAAIPKGL